MPISTWIRDLFGIRKDIIDTKKTILETEKLIDERRARDLPALLSPVSLAEIQKYDPKIQQLIKKVETQDLFTLLNPNSDILLEVRARQIKKYRNLRRQAMIRFFLLAVLMATASLLISGIVLYGLTRAGR
jgi:hypothetical protein